MKKKGSISNLILTLMLLLGLSMILYPTVSNAWNSRYRNNKIASYTQGVANLNNNRYEEIWNNAREYNKRLTQKDFYYALTPDQKQDYLSQLSVEGVDVMGYIEIPKIKVNLPVYHTTEEAILQTAIGHIDWTSLPTGGEGTHCAFSGHRGLPSARLFTDLDQLAVGDTFVVWILDEKMTYEVDQVLIVEPSNIEDLKIVEGMDLCTLVTCTPYGVNSHRMLVRGRRVENMAAQAVKRVTADAVRIEPAMVAPVVAAPMLLLIFIILLIPSKKTKRRKKVD